MNCNICLNDYDSELHRPVVGTCGHTVCDTCRVHLEGFKCPTCRVWQSFQKKTSNFQVLDCLELLKAVKKEHASQKNTERERSIIAAEEAYQKSLAGCSDCRLAMTSLIGRVAKDCSEDGAALMNAYEAVARQNADRVSLCSACRLQDDATMERRSTLSLALKLADRAAKEFIPVFADVKNSEDRMKPHCQIGEARSRPVLCELRQMAAEQRSEADFDELLEVGKRFAKRYADVAAKMETDPGRYLLFSAQQWVQRMKQEMFSIGRFV